LFALTVAVVIATVPLSLGGEPLYDTVLYGLMTLALGVAGTLVASRQPANPIGWLLCSMAVFAALGEFAEGYGEHEVFAGAESAQWFASWGWAVGAGQWALVFVLFPAGRLASPRWRLVVWMTIAATVLIVVGSALGHVGDSDFTSGENPYAIDGVGVEAVHATGQALFVIAFVAAVASLIVCFRRSVGVERQQLKWVAYAVSALAVVGPLAVVTYYDSVPVRIAIAIALTAVPVAVCIAILHYRLYDIDVVINRTLVYAALTILLSGAYVATTLVLGTALGSDSAWATAGATLAVAAAFRPLRAYVQDIVDRRFNRARYDALRRVGAFLEDLRAGRTAPEAIEDVLRDVLSDPQLQLRFFLADSKLYVDAHGHVATDQADDGRQRTPVQRAGVPLGLVVHGPVDEQRARLLEHVVGRAGLAIEITRLRVEVRRQLANVEASRARIVTAGYEERRRIERDIHDGAQQRLVGIGLALRHAQHELGASPATRTLESAIEEISLAIKDLRDLANGVRPAHLDGGLAHALRDLAGRAPLPVDVRVTSERYPRDVEAAAYFVACEAVTNAIKHASAKRVVVRAQRENESLVICVSDDGIGGASPTRGSGLRGLSDRVAAHGGLLLLDSTNGHGTTLTAQLPCAS
jgi:signal transduction histidine kinase